METINIEAEGNVGMACHNPNEKLNIPSYITGEDYKCPLIFSDGHIGIGTPYVSPDLNIYKK